MKAIVIEGKYLMSDKEDDKIKSGYKSSWKNEHKGEAKREGSSSKEFHCNHCKVNSESKEYKIAPLQHRDLLEKLFDGLSTTRDFAWSSGMASIPSTQQSEYVPLPDDINIDDTQVPHDGVDYPWEGEAIPSYEPSLSPVRELTPGTTRTPVSQVCVRTQSKGKRSTAAVQLLKLMELVQSLISAFSAQGASSTSSNDDTTSEVLKVLKNMVSSYEIDNVVFFKSLKFLGGKDEYNYG
ncbi:hypothetical protein GIB67_010634 [Kingdonia uniflora]|uniref:Uncharacterized protein n=1 Tax=Kingdonia uniflora TaxID=39325 RepID=A0A7J7NQG2_9MAGN|nr:hypothetical protein GIB67_010634 [Kingdonia uniflora]